MEKYYDFFAYGDGIYRTVITPKFQPKTAGELRRRLHELGDPWSVDSRLGDDDPIPEYPLSKPADQEKAPGAIKPQIIEGKLDDLLKKKPPANPFLRAYWAHVDLLPPDDPGIDEGSLPPGLKPKRQARKGEQK